MSDDESLRSDHASSDDQLEAAERAVEAERTKAATAAERLISLQRITTALQSRMSADEVAAVILAEVAPEMGGSNRAMWLADPPRNTLRLVLEVEPDPATEPFAELSLDSDLPGPLVVRTGEPIFVPSARERNRRFPALAAVETTRSFAVLPLATGDSVAGVLALGFDGDHNFDHDEQLFLTAVAFQAGQALERGRLVAAERRNAERIRILADASAALASSLEYDETLTKVARLAIPAIADAAAVHLVDGDVLRRVTFAHREPEMERWLEDFAADHGDEVRMAAVDEAVERGEAVLVADLAGRVAAPLIDALGVTSVVALPLIARGATLGALTLLRFADSPVFEAEDLSFFEELARRAAVAIDNSRGHARRVALVANLERSVERGRQLLAFASDLAEALSVEQVADVVVTRSRDALGAVTGGVALLDESRRFLHFIELESSTKDQGVWTGTPVTVDAPMGVAVRRRRSIFHSSREELVAAYPDLDKTVDAGKHAFAQIPLVVSGQVTGVLSLAWSANRPFDDEERDFIELLANQCAQALERSRLFAEKQEAAETLSRAILPDRLPEIDGWQLAARYQPAGAGVPVGGDWFDAWQLPDGRLGIAVGDVGGHGIRAAAVMGQLRNALRAYAHRLWDPGIVVGRLDELLASSELDIYATALYMILDPATGEIAWSNAGHPPPLYVRPDGSGVYWSDMHGSLLGLGRGAHEQSSGVIEPGAMIVGFTDGLIEHRDEDLTDGLEQLRHTTSNFADDPQVFLTDLIARAAGGRRQEDDLCVLVVRRALAP